MTITDWIMCGLTAIYVVATIFILRANTRSAKAAAKQLEETQRIQEQNVAISLLDHRARVYYQLTEWLEYAGNLTISNRPEKDSLWRFFVMVKEKSTFVPLSDPILSRCDDKTISVILQRLKPECNTILLIEQLFCRISESEQEAVRRFTRHFMDLVLHIDTELLMPGVCTKRVQASVEELNSMDMLNLMKQEMKMLTDCEER